MKNTTHTITPASFISKGGLPAYLMFGAQGFIAVLPTLNDALAYGEGNLILESSMNCHPRPIYRAFALVGYANSAPFWQETTIEAGYKMAFGALMDSHFQSFSPKGSNGHKPQFTSKRDDSLTPEVDAREFYTEREASSVMDALSALVLLPTPNAR